MNTAKSPEGAKDVVTRDDPEADQRHGLVEDAMALLSATLFMSLGLVLFQKVGLYTGGTAGLAFLLHYRSGWPLGAIFFAINLPFAWLAWRHLGRAFALRTLAAVGLIAALSEATPHWIVLDRVAPGYAALAGGVLMGTALLVLFRHRASLGGIGVLALWLQERHGIRAGKFQMGVDVCIVLGALAATDLARVAWSVLGAVAVNLVLAMNHKPGRYRGLS